MASWRDGAAYAPIERPDGFASPEAAPLPVAPPRAAQTPGALAPPLRLDLPQAQPPLQQIGAKRDTERNPKQPYETVSALISAGPTTADGQRDPKAPFRISGAGPKPDPEVPPPSGEPTIRVEARAPQTQWGPPVASGMPGNQFYAQQPGLPPQWAPPAPKPAVNRNLILVSYAALLIGAFFSVTAPWMLLVVGGLLSQTRVATKHLWLWSLTGGIILVFLELVGVSTSRIGWLACLGMIAAVSIADYSALKRR